MLERTVQQRVAILFMLVRRRLNVFAAQCLIEPINRTTQMGNSYRASDYQGNIKRIEELRSGHACDYALFDV